MRAEGIISPPQKTTTGDKRHGDQSRRPAARWKTDGIYRIRLGDAVRDGAEGSERRRCREGKEDRDFRPARRVHAHLLGEARAGLRAEHRSAEEERRERS